MKTTEEISESFAKLLREGWKSADELSFAMAEAGLEVSRSSCVAWRSAKSIPRFDVGIFVLRLTLTKMSNDIETLQKRQSQFSWLQEFVE